MSVRALVYELSGAVGVGAVDVAGRPLLVRQLQSLRDLGVQDEVVEPLGRLFADAHGVAELGALCLRHRLVTRPGVVG